MRTILIIQTYPQQLIIILNNMFHDIVPRFLAWKLYGQKLCQKDWHRKCLSKLYAKKIGPNFAYAKTMPETWIGIDYHIISILSTIY